MVREKRLVNLYAVRCGMLRFNFLLDCCQPGSVPDAHLIAALLDLVSESGRESFLSSSVSGLFATSDFGRREGSQPSWMRHLSVGLQSSCQIASCLLCRRRQSLPGQRCCWSARTL